MLELERTFLASRIPDGLSQCHFKEMRDHYFPVHSRHAKLRARMRGDAYELTKKTPVNEGDASSQIEETIRLTREEFDAICLAPSKVVSKRRYYLPFGDLTAEVDVFKGGLEGLVLVDFEFQDEDSMRRFSPPGFCLADVTQEEFIAGGALCGKDYADIAGMLEKFGYRAISLI